jgi:hypothetical protein
MRTFLRVSAAVVLCAACGTAVRAQNIGQPAQPPGPGGPGGPGGGPIKIQPGGPPVLPFGNPQLELLKDAGVQKELKLKDEQIKKVNTLVEQQADVLKMLGTPDGNKKVMEQMEASKKGVAEALDKDQLKRLNQLVLQARGPTALFDPKIGEELKITAEQKMQLGKAISMAMQKRIADLKDIKDLKPEDLTRKMQEWQRSATDDVVKTLTPEQQKQWGTMVGETYKGTLPAVPGGFGGFGGPVLPPPPGGGFGPPPPPAPLPPEGLPANPGRQ